MYDGDDNTEVFVPGGPRIREKEKNNERNAFNDCCKMTGDQPSPLGKGRPLGWREG